MLCIPILLKKGDCRISFRCELDEVFSSAKCTAPEEQVNCIALSYAKRTKTEVKIISFTEGVQLVSSKENKNGQMQVIHYVKNKKKL